MEREQRLAGAFVELADTLVDDFDVIEFLHRLAQLCVDLLPVDAAGILLTDQVGHLQPVAASSEQARLLELLQLQSVDGPCLKCFATGQAVLIGNLTTEAAQWPAFAERAVAAGFSGLVALPMRLRHQRLGAMNAMNLFTSGAVGSVYRLDAGEWTLAQAFAEVATIGILGERAAREHQLLAQQLQFALNSRVIIEQAKGMLAERGQISVDQAFVAMRDFARRSSRKLSAVAQAVIDNDALVAGLARQA